jgi:endonuclease-8
VEIDTTNVYKGKMPEGPEVRVMTCNIRNLIYSVDNPELISVEVIQESFKKRCSNLDKFQRSPVKEVNSKGKFTYIRLHNGTSIGITYGMTGNIRSEDDFKDRHLVVKFTHSNGVFYYHSTRHFGCIKLLTEAELDTKLASLGPDILDFNPLSMEQVVKIWRCKPKAHITNVLLTHQNLISGIGNYIKSEIMYRAHVYPFATVDKLTDETLYKLYLEARTVANLAFTDGGASLYTYTDLSGDKSDLTFKLKLQVYGKDTDPEGRLVAKIETPDKRTTHWVSQVQTIGSTREKPPIALTSLVRL